jgi:Lrp/AsnC family transcriptional regulator, leucine-responsive regulatory protein
MAKLMTLRYERGTFIENWTIIPMKQKPALDRLDWKILEALQENARYSNTAIGKRIGLSQPAVTARIQRLEERGIIAGYAARIAAKLVGAEISAFIRLNAPHSALRACLAEFEAMPEIVEAHRITGVDCFIVKVVVFGMSELEATVDRIAHFGPVTTSVVLGSYPSKPIKPPPETKETAKLSNRAGGSRPKRAGATPMLKSTRT